jgi:hypothetical protein
VYAGYRIYGPYGAHRKIVVLVSPGHRTTMSYARYLMSVHIGRELVRDEEVDHIDDDCTNDAIENLQILSSRQNRQKQAKAQAVKMVSLACCNCQVEFLREPRNVRRKSATRNPCCSRSCAAKYQHKLRSTRDGLESDPAGPHKP